MDIKWNADFINEKIKTVINNKSNKKIVNKSTGIEKVIALVNLELKGKLDNLRYEDRETLNLLDDKGITVIIELDYPITTKNEQLLKEMYEEKGYFFQYCQNDHKKKYFICVGSKK